MTTGQEVNKLAIESAFEEEVEVDLIHERRVEVEFEDKIKVDQGAAEHLLRNQLVITEIDSEQNLISIKSFYNTTNTGIQPIKRLR